MRQQDGNGREHCGWPPCCPSHTAHSQGMGDREGGAGIREWREDQWDRQGTSGCLANLLITTTSGWANQAKTRAARWRTEGEGGGSGSGGLRRASSSAG